MDLSVSMPPTTPTIEVVVLDLAGTTVSDPGVVEAAVRTAAGARFNANTFHRYRGGAKLDMLAALVGDDSAAFALEAFEAELLRAITEGAIEPLPHAEEALRDLRELGVRTCLTTGFSPAIRTALLTALGWNLVVDLALSPEPGLRGRPAPDLILTAAMRLEATQVASIAVVGDTSNDITAARRAGAGVAAGVLTGAHDRRTLERAEPTHVFAHVGVFAEFIIGLPRNASE